ncbi:hypothetical protein VB618_19265 [Microvirga sp. CF3062]|uniref:hypothetical protein n=1 Tax=Microvirga sp. CF3062 TaxID=3110182 RepID=UPI002E793152|nr:hypothetical protein [Microvirga sp. CF3062]MEE1658344.1 hypothetical protein [Microvirga sp. CF3062]
MTATTMGRFLKSYNRPTATVLAGMLLPFTAIGLQVGTGGSATAGYYIAKGGKGYPLAVYDVSASDGLDADPTPRENLARIRTILKPTVTELANVLEVSRQAIYDWQNGQPITAENAAKLDDLARAADVFAAEGLTTSNQMLRRSIRGGKSFFDMVRFGGSAEEAARTLVQLIRKELEQRKAIDARLAARKRIPVTHHDLGMPSLDEQG